MPHGAPFPPAPCLCTHCTTACPGSLSSPRSVCHDQTDWLSPRVSATALSATHGRGPAGTLVQKQEERKLQLHSLMRSQEAWEAISRSLRLLSTKEPGNHHQAHLTWHCWWAAGGRAAGDSPANSPALPAEDFGQLDGAG